MPIMDREPKVGRKGVTRTRRPAAWQSNAIAPFFLGMAIWAWIASTSRTPEAWNDPRFWPALLVAGFLLGLILDRAPSRNGVLLGAGGSLVGIVKTLVLLKELALLPAVPVLILVFIAAGVLSTRSGAVARGALERLNLLGHRPTLMYRRRRRPAPVHAF
jgi:hypothetical protein